jgi:colicin import membrane protein
MSIKDEVRQERRKFSVWVGIAAAVHVAVIVAVVLLQIYFVFTHPPMKIVSVSLVSMPGIPGAAGGPKIAPQPAPSVAKEPSEPKPVAVRKVPEPQPPQPKKIPEPVVTKKVPQPVPVPKKETQVDLEKLRQQNLQSTLEQLKKKTTTQKPASNAGNMNNTLANLQKKVAAQGGGGPASSGFGSGGGGGRAGKGGGAFDPYQARIAGIIEGNWFFSRQLVRNAPGLEVYVEINILPDGSLGEFRFDRKSSSEYLNNAAKNAIMKSVPFPQVPKEYGPRGVRVGFAFTPEGLAR